MIDIQVTDDFLAKWVEIKLACIECDVEVVEYSQPLWNLIDNTCNEIQGNTKIEDISQFPAIHASRKAYKALGKDPARYRLSAEALLRRIVKGNQLYQINNVVDLVNLASVMSGFSIGGYDVSKISGEVKLGIGKPDEPYRAIGRGELNVESLPVLRDSIGAFGSPTSDSERTSVKQTTHHFLMVYFAFGNHDKLESAVNHAAKLLEQFASAQNFHVQIY